MTKLLLASAICASLAAAVVGGHQAPPPPQAPPAVELQVGDQAPDFTLPGSDGKPHRLSDYKGRAVVLAWFPAAFTGG
jgi:peroxiredoxin Q/BCP